VRKLNSVSFLFCPVNGARALRKRTKNKTNVFRAASGVNFLFANLKRIDVCDTHTTIWNPVAPACSHETFCDNRHGNREFRSASRVLNNVTGFISPRAQETLTSRVYTPPDRRGFVFSGRCTGHVGENGGLLNAITSSSDARINSVYLHAVRRDTSENFFPICMDPKRVLIF